MGKALPSFHGLGERKHVYRRIAQSVEQRTFNPWVGGSIPSAPTACRECG